MLKRARILMGGEVNCGHRSKHHAGTATMAGISTNTMHRRPHWWIPLAALVATTVLAVAACSSRASQSTINKHLNAPSPSTPSTAGQALKATSPCPASAKLPANTVDKGGANATGATLHVDAGDTYFTPTCVLKVAPNTSVTLVVRNVGQMLHNVSVSDQGIDQDVDAGQTITMHIKVGTVPVVYFCKYHRSLGMTASLVPSA